MENTFPHKKNEEIILNIINDALMFERLCIGSSIGFNKVAEKLPIQDDYNGILSAYKILGDKTCRENRDELNAIFMSYAENNLSLNTASKNIYLEWLQEIKEPNTNL